jgi:lactate dehydrogenase-like 2-hydroxyacid dehydrogenase
MLPRLGSNINQRRQKKMKKDVMLIIGAGQIGMAIARRVGFGKKIILGDKNIDNNKPCGREFLLTEHILQRFPVINCNHRRGIGYDPGFFQFSQFPVK